MASIANPTVQERIGDNLQYGSDMYRIKNHDTDIFFEI
jgi:hypothetical protein